MLFPQLAGKKLGQINLAQLAKEWCQTSGFIGPNNPFLDPSFCQQFLDEVHASREIDWSYGGWLEDRSELWRGTYLTDRRTGLHLGVDFNVPSGTLVAADRRLQVLRTDNDDPEPHGWGSRIVARVLDGPMGTDNPFALIYAHLQNITRLRGEVVAPGDILAEVGQTESNGGWYPHLHVQVVWEPNDQRLLDRLSEIDGYGQAGRRYALRTFYPNPLRFVSVR